MAENYIGNEQVTGSRGSNHGVVNLESGKWEIDDVAVNVSAANLNRPVLLTIPLPGTLDVRGGAASDGVLYGGYFTDNALKVLTEDNSAATFADETTDAGDAGAADVTMPDPFDTDDAIYLGYNVPFSLVKILPSTAGAGDAVASELAYEYWDGAEWTALSLVLDSSGGFTAGTSNYFLSFLPPDDWATKSVNASTAYYFIRIRATADDVFNTTQPVLTQIRPLIVSSTTGGLVVPATGTITAAYLNAWTASATNNDTELLIGVRHVADATREFERVTWTKGDAADVVTGLDLDVAVGDTLALQILQEDGTTEFANGSMILQIDVD